MANFLLLHGAASTGWLWHRVEPELQRAGYETVAPDLPSEDPTADLHTDIATHRPVDRIVLVSPMIPHPQETGMDWWEATGQPAAQRAYLESLGYTATDADNPDIVFMHDFDDELKAGSLANSSDQQSGLLLTPRPFDACPQIPTHLIAAGSDRLFPLDFMRQQAEDRTGITPDVIPGGHGAVLTQAGALAQLLMRYEARDEEPAS